MIEYHVLREIQNNPKLTQRSLAKSLDISLGKANYVLSGLIDKGIIKAKKLKNNPEKIRWKYILTPQGIQDKVQITRDYLKRRLSEYEHLQIEIEELKAEVSKEKTVID